MRGVSSLALGPYAATTVEIARPHSSTSRAEGRCLVLGVLKVMSNLASRLWLYHEAGCLSETYVVKHRHGYYEKGGGTSITYGCPCVFPPSRPPWGP